MVGAGWAAVWQHRLPTDDVARFVGDESQLAQITGTVDGEPYLSDPRRGVFGEFSYRQPSTVFVLRVDSIVVDGAAQHASGRVYARVRQADHRLQQGDRVRVTGWLGPILGPANPGERDWRISLASRGIRGRLTLVNRGNWSLVERPTAGWFTAVRRWCESGAVAALHVGAAFEPQRRAFLEAILLGRRGGDLAELEEHFRRVGLAHLLAISGAHLMVLLGLVWLGARVLGLSPPRVAAVVLAVLVWYLLTVVPRVPILRAAVMSGLFTVGYATGRRMRALELVALAALLILIWRPSELLSVGFQLSFGIVFGLLVFVEPVSRWLWRGFDAPYEQHQGSWWRWPARWLVGYVAVSVIAFLIAMPLVAYHFRYVSLLGVAASLLAWPLVMAVLGVGYLKVLIGQVLPSAGVLLVWPLQRSADGLTGLVAWMSEWPGAGVTLHTQPTLVWLVGALAVVAAWLAGRFVQRRVAFVVAVGLCVVGVVDLSTVTSPLAQRMGVGGERPALTLNMFSVGDGSCYLLRVAGDEQQHTLMFDCGSQHDTGVGSDRIVPALQHLRVSRIDTLVISHADLDHFNGSLDVVDRVKVGRVFVPPQMLDAARRDPGSASAVLIEQLRRRGVPVGVISRGWREAHGGAVLEVLWPPEGLRAQRVNDTSVVLSVRVAGRHVVLNGDIQQDAIESLLALEADVRADVVDLPHHGSFIEASPRWLQAVAPAVVLQSCGPGRFSQDKWGDWLERLSIQRLTTAEAGMVELIIERGGEVRWEGFKVP